MSIDLMQEIAPDGALRQAYDWLCERRKDYSANSDVWDLRWRWNEIKPPREQELLDGSYRFDALRRIRRDNDTLELWSALDALVLKAMAAHFMDDWVILSPTRWKLRKAIKIVNMTLAELKLRQHPDKTFIGRVSRGFDFLGYSLSPSGLAVAAKPVRKFAERVTQLYEQGADTSRIRVYAKRWQTWVQSGLNERRVSTRVVLPTFSDKLVALDGAFHFNASATGLPLPGRP